MYVWVVALCPFLGVIEEGLKPWVNHYTRKRELKIHVYTTPFDGNLVTRKLRKEGGRMWDHDKEPTFQYITSIGYVYRNSETLLK